MIHRRPGGRRHSAWPRIQSEVCRTVAEAGRPAVYLPGTIAAFVHPVRWSATTRPFSSLRDARLYLIGDWRHGRIAYIGATRELLRFRGNTSSGFFTGDCRTQPHTYRTVSDILGDPSLPPPVEMEGAGRLLGLFVPAHGRHRRQRPCRDRAMQSIQEAGLHVPTGYISVIGVRRARIWGSTPLTIIDHHPVALGPDGNNGCRRHPGIPQPAGSFRRHADPGYARVPVSMIIRRSCRNPEPSPVWLVIFHL